MAAKRLLLAAALAASGCGTMGNLKDHDRIYGGVAIDAAPVRQACKDLVSAKDDREFTLQQDGVILTYGVIDLPLSAVMDTLTLPITVTRTLFPRTHDAAKHAEAIPVTGEPPMESGVPTAAPVQVP
jgi:uncharacterized protein YceK